MEQPLISIIVPVYKVEMYLDRCIKSIINQTYKNLEIILVNDGSPDNCPIICDKYAAEDQRIKVIHKSNGGLSSARNSGLDIMNGKFLTFVDSDDFIHNDYVSKLYELCVNNNCQIAQCSFQKGNENDINSINDKIVINKYDHIGIFSKRSFKVTVWAKLYESSLFTNVRFPQGKINEDEFITYRVAYNAKNIIITNEKLYYYYQSSDSIMRNNSEYIKLDFIEAYEERIEFFNQAEEWNLVNISIKELCIQLIICYIKCKSYRNNKNNTAMLIKKFNQSYSQIRDYKFVSINEKIILIIFRLMPNISAFLINKLIKR